MKMQRILKVLRYTMEPPSRGTVHRAYRKWREERGIPVRCDNENCVFHQQPMMWNAVPLPVILDHRNGNNSDNHPENLRWLCPNCDSQLETRGGKNKGRIQKSEGGFAIVRRDGKKDYIMPAESGHYALEGQAPAVLIAPADQKSLSS